MARGRYAIRHVGPRRPWRDVSQGGWAGPDLPALVWACAAAAVGGHWGSCVIWASALPRRSPKSGWALAHRLDLYQVHQPNPLVRDGTIMRGMRALQRVELVGEVGVSNYSLRRWRAAEDALGSRVLSNQVPYSLVARFPERDLLPFAQAHGRVVLAYSPLAQGLLSGRYDPGNRPANRVRAANPLFLPVNLQRAAELIAALREVAEAHSATPAQIALAWVIRHPAVAAIPGASSVEKLEHNAAAADIDLTSDQYQALAAAAVRFRPITGPAAIPQLARA